MAGRMKRKGRQRYEDADPEADATEMQSLRSDLERRFKPVFDRHDRYGVPLAELNEELNDEGIGRMIRQDRLNYLLAKADRDKNALITYSEFIELMTSKGTLTKEERRAFTSVLEAAIANIVPRSQREDFMANYHCRPPPFFIPIISLAEIIIFIVYAVELQNAGQVVDWDKGVPMYSPLVYRPSKRQEAWRFLTYMLIHQGILHILFNMIFQILFGLPLEIVHKWWRVMIVYLCGVIAGSLAHSISDHAVALVGASGGVYALLGAHMAAIITNWKEMNYECCEGNPCRALLSAPVRLLIILVLVVPDTGIAVYRRVTAPERFKVGVTAHIGGFLAGLLLGVPVLKNINRLPWETNLGWVTLAVFLAFIAFACLFNGLYHGYPETEW